MLPGWRISEITSEIREDTALTLYLKYGIDVEKRYYSSAVTARKINYQAHNAP